MRHCRSAPAVHLQAGASAGARQTRSENRSGRELETPAVRAEQLPAEQQLRMENWQQIRPKPERETGCVESGFAYKPLPTWLKTISHAESFHFLGERLAIASTLGRFYRAGI